MVFNQNFPSSKMNVGTSCARGWIWSTDSIIK